MLMIRSITIGVYVCVDIIVGIAWGIVELVCLVDAQVLVDGVIGVARNETRRLKVDSLRTT